jgi:hypothetical protein
MKSLTTTLATVAALTLLAIASPAASAAPPTITNTAVSHVTTTSATLEAEINPSEKATRYHFEYVDQAGFEAAGFANATKAPVPEGKVPAKVAATGDLSAGSGTVSNLVVSAGALAPGQAITGPGIPAATTILSLGAGKLTLSNAATATAAAVALTATGAQPASAPIAGLGVHVTYRYRVLASNPDAPNGVEGPAQTFTTFQASPSFEPCLANEAFRAGPLAPLDHPSAALPDCRVYEQASPVAKNGVDALGTVGFTKASVNGDAIGFGAASGIPGAEGSQELPLYLATRDPDGWSTQGLLPPQSSGESAFVLGWTPDFSEVFDQATRLGPPDDSSFIERSSADRSIAEIVPKGKGLSSELDTEPHFVGTSAGGARVVFESNAKLLPAALAGKSNVYVWDKASGSLSLAGALNDASPEGISPPQGAFAGSYDWIAGTNSGTLQQGGAASFYYTQDNHAVAADGSVFFTTAGDGQLYLRRNPTQEQSKLDGQGNCTEAAKACTVHISASRKTNGTGAANGSGKADAAGTRPAAFQAASADGSKVFFTSTEKLTNDANTGPEQEPPAIGRSDLEGNNLETGFFPAAVAQGVAVFGGYIYWAEPEAHAIGRAKLNPGTGKPEEEEPHFIVPPETEFETHPLTEPGVLHSAPATPRYVAVDSGHVYWTNTGPLGGDHENSEGGDIRPEDRAVVAAGTIGRAALDGSDDLVPSSVEAGFISGATNPQGIAVNSEHLYWANAGEELATRTIGRAKLGVGGAEEVEGGFIAVDFGFQELVPQGIAVNATHIYAAVDGAQQFSSIFRYDIGGSPANEIFFGDGQHPGVPGVRGISLDGSHVYWGRQGENSIGRINLALEAASAELEFIKEAGHPQGLAEDSGHLYWSVNGEVQPNPGNDLYRYQPASGKLSDLAVDTADPDGAEVKGILGTSEDGSAVYFVANGVPDGVANSPNGHGESAEAGSCQGTTAQGVDFTGECNLYLAREGSPTVFIARLGTKRHDLLDWLPRNHFNSGLQGEGKEARVSADGAVVLFRSQRQLSAYENHGAPELYRYQAGAAAPTCVSCDPSGEAPSREGSDTAGNISLSALLPPEFNFVLSRNLSADGKRAFFQTSEALVGADTNGADGCPEEGTSQNHFPSCQDVYEWEAQGSGSCEEDVQGGGCLYLLSTGKSRQASFLADASASGNDVFLMTSQPGLVGQDQDHLYDVYDARVGGGLASQNETVPLPCEGEGCKPGAGPVPAPLPCGSACFAGPANPKPKQPRHHKAKKHHHKHKHHKKAKPNRRASR